MLKRCCFCLHILIKYIHKQYYPIMLWIFIKLCEPFCNMFFFTQHYIFDCFFTLIHRHLKYSFDQLYIIQLMDFYFVLCPCVSVYMMSINAATSSPLLTPLNANVRVPSICLEVSLWVYSNHIYSFTGFCQITSPIILLDLFLSTFWFYCDCKWKKNLSIILIIAGIWKCYGLGYFNRIANKCAELSHSI